MIQVSFYVDLTQFRPLILSIHAIRTENVSLIQKLQATNKTHGYGLRDCDKNPW